MGRTPRSTRVRWLGLLISALLIPACNNSGSSSGGGGPTGILWNSQATGPASGGSGSAGDSLWVDPNSGLGASAIGISNIITSADDATYDGYYSAGSTGLNSTKITYMFGNLHPLSTDTGSQAITTRENQLQGMINGYRQQQLGNVGGGGDPFGGGIGVGNVTGVILAGHFKGTKSARAHCKHYALYHGGTMPAGANAEGDALQTTTGQANPFGTPAPGNPDGDQGRLGKIEVVAFNPAVAQNDLVVQGAPYGEADAVFSQLLISSPATLGAMGWTNFAVGHWRGGVNAFYWNIIFLVNPVPAN